MAFFPNLFGQSNASQQGATLTGNQPSANSGQQTGNQGNSGNQGQGNPNFPGTSQLNPQNNNQQMNPPGGDGTSNDPNNNADPNKGTQGSPMDAFKDWYKLPENNNNSGDVFAQPIVNVDSAKLTEATRKVNFAQGVDPALVQKALQGDPQAFMQAINQVAQNAFLAATTSTGSVVDGALRTYHTRLDGSLPDRVRQVQISQEKQKHPSLNHPSAAPLIDAFKTQVARSNPQLSPQQVTDYAERYFLTFAEDITTNDPNKKAVATSNKPGEPDFSSFMA